MDKAIRKELGLDKNQQVKPTTKLIKQIFAIIDRNVYGNYIKNNVRVLNLVLTDEIEGDSATRIRNGEHFLYINRLAFVDNPNSLEYLRQLLQSESVVVALDLYHDVKRNKDRPYDLFGLRRKCVSMELFGEYLHNDRVPSKEIVWFETSAGIIQQGTVVENVKDQQMTVIKTKDGERHTIADVSIYGISRDDYFVK